MKAIWKYTCILALGGAAIVVPATSVALTSQNSFVSDNSTNGNNSGSNNDNGGTDSGDSNEDSNKPVIPENPIKINNNISVTSTFEDILKGFDSNKTMNDAMTDILNKEENISKVVTNYEQFENKNIELKVTGIQQNSSDWGTTPYSTWSATAPTKAIVNDYSEVFTISTLNDLKTQLTNEKIKTLIKDSKIEGQYTDFTLDANSALGVEQFDNGVKDLVHVNIIATNAEALVRTPTNIDLGIPISNIKYDIKSAKITGTINQSAKETITNSEINVSFGIDSKIENTYTRDIVFQPESGQDSKSNVSLQELLTRFNWTTPTSKFLILENIEQASNLNSNKIGKDLGIYNVDFLSVYDSTEIAIGNEGYNGMDLTFIVKPKSGFVWEDGTNNEKSLRVGQIQVKIQDGYATTYCRTYPENSRYWIRWYDMFKDNQEILNKYPNSLEEARSLFTNPDFFSFYDETVRTFPEFAKDFKNINFYLKDPSHIDNGTGEINGKKNFNYAFYVKPIPGHLMKTNSMQTTEALWFRLSYTKT